MTSPRDFDLGDILSITTGVLVSPRLMEGVHEFLTFMAGELVWTHQLPRVAREARPVILHQHPQLADCSFTISEPTSRQVDMWLAAQKRRFGDTLPILPLNADEHERIDPLSELVEKVHPSKIMAVTK
jgi:hypothetical protein